MCPDHEHIIDISPPSEGLSWSSAEEGLFWMVHEDAGKGGGHFCAHGCAVHLKIVRTVECELVFGKDGVNEMA